MSKKTAPALEELDQALALKLSSKKAAEPAIVRWVARNVENPDPDPEECPDPFAWTLLRLCKSKENPGFLSFFVEKLWAKLIPTKSQLDSGAPRAVDGKPTIELYERILSIKTEAEAGDVPEPVPATEEPPHEEDD